MDEILLFTLTEPNRVRSILIHEKDGNILSCSKTLDNTKPVEMVTYNNAEEAILGEVLWASSFESPPNKLDGYSIVYHHPEAARVALGIQREKLQSVNLS